jgi:xanthine dehydrogenase YagR molybdenum-binding subunit
MTTTALPLIGEPLDRVDGRRKVTGQAPYAADRHPEGLVYGFIVLSSTANGRITAIDVAEAERQSGVIAVLTHRNAPRVHTEAHGQIERVLKVLQDDVVAYDRQPVAVVVADTFVRAKYAASLVRVSYDRLAPRTTLEAGEMYVPEKIMGKPSETRRGDDATAVLQRSAVRIDNVYTTPVEHHNPMEPHATIAQWHDGALTVYDATQGVIPARARLAAIFGLPLDQVRVVTTFTGGAFGSKGSVWPHTVLAAMAAKMTGRPVQIALWRPQMWSSVGYRPQTRQRVALGASPDGRLTTQIHETTSQTSMIDEFVEPSGTITTMLYASPSLHVSHTLSRLNYATPTFMRAPGESSGSFALESAMDELAYATGLDPIDLRLRNYAETDPTERKPFSSKSLRECYRRGAEAIGWSTRNPAPRSMRDGRDLIGIGMATATYPTNRSKASATVTLMSDGTARVRSGGVDIGTGAYTAFAQIAAETLGLPIDRVIVELGDSTYPDAPVAGGSQLTASLGTAVRLAAQDARDKRAAAGSSGEPIEGRADAAPDEDQAYSTHAFGAQFAVVRVDPDLGTVRLVRQVGAFASGRIINAKTARSQYLGGMVFGVGMALLEESRPDLRTGRYMNANLGEYLVPVHADMGAMEALIVEEYDPFVNPIGVKGIGEIGIVGAAAAIANAVYHATGKRIRDLPITPPKLLSA